jgi:hypothetical protein
MPENTAKVDRSTPFGNPFPANVYGQDRAIDLFGRWLSGAMSTRKMAVLSRQLVDAALRLSRSCARHDQTGVAKATLEEPRVLVQARPAVPC